MSNMLSFLVLVTVLFSTGSCDDIDDTIETHWGCPFHGPNYRIPRNSECDGPVWGTEISPMHFFSIKELDKFTAKLEEIRRNVFRNNLLNDVETADKLYDAFKKSPEKEWTKFTATYFPQDVSSREDNLGLTIKVLKEIAAEKRWKDVNKHAFIAAGAVNFPVHIGRVKKITGEPEDDGEDFEVDRIFGLIKFEVNNRIGHMIIDMQNAVTPIPIVMLDNQNLYLENENRKNKVLIAGFEKEYTSFGSKVKYMMVKKSEEFFIQAIHYDKAEDIKRDVTLIEEAIFTNQPLCSIVQTQSTFLVESPQRIIAQVDPDDSTLKAFIIVTMNKKEGSKLFEVGYVNSQSKEVSIEFNSMDEITDVKYREVFDRVCSILKFEGQKKESLLSSLMNLQAIVAGRIGEHFTLY